MTLTNKQEMFIIEYLKTFNATKAAIAAGYSEKTARQMGSENLSKPDISEVIRARMEEYAMPAYEVLYHLTEIGRGDIDDILDSKGNLDLDKARANGKTRLIKKIKQRAITTEESDIVETEIELYDGQRAAELMGKYHKLFTDRQEITGANGQPLSPIHLVEVVRPPADEKPDISD